MILSLTIMTGVFASYGLGLCGHKADGGHGLKSASRRPRRSSIEPAPRDETDALASWPRCSASRITGSLPKFASPRMSAGLCGDGKLLGPFDRLLADSNLFPEVRLRAVQNGQGIEVRVVFHGGSVPRLGHRSREQARVPAIGSDELTRSHRPPPVEAAAGGSIKITGPSYYRWLCITKFPPNSRLIVN